jgi:hypothetical protein
MPTVNDIPTFSPRPTPSPGSGRLRGAVHAHIPHVADALGGGIIGALRARSTDLRSVGQNERASHGQPRCSAARAAHLRRDVPVLGRDVPDPRTGTQGSWRGGQRPRAPPLSRRTP